MAVLEGFLGKRSAPGYLGRKPNGIRFLRHQFRP